jgi:hypothetical protein
MASLEETVNNSSTIHHGIWTNSGAEQLRFPFTGKPDDDP